MQHILFNENSSNKITILIKTTAFNKASLLSNYVDPLIKLGVSEADIIAFDLEYDNPKKCSAKAINTYLGTLLPVLESLGTKILYVCDAEYFKKLTKETKTEAHYGYVLPCKIKGFEDFDVVFGTNYQALFYNPDLQEKLDLSLEALAQKHCGLYTTIGSNIIESGYFPESLAEIEDALNALHKHPELVLDAETFSLRFWEAGIGTVAFAWNEHNGIAFCCDYRENTYLSGESWYGYQKPNYEVYKLLKNFLETYQGKLIYHNQNFDAKILIYVLWMKNMLDQEGMLKGLKVLTKNSDDTKLIAYLAINSCSGNNLKLKYLAHEFAGNYAQSDINDIRRIPKVELLKYNLIDCLATHYVRNKYKPIMIKDNQESVYNTIMIPSVKVILQAELTGMPINKKAVENAQTTLKLDILSYNKELFNIPLIKDFITQLRKEECLLKNLLLKVKVKPLSDFDNVTFNPGSPKQLQKLLYDYMGYEATDFTAKKQPSTKTKSIKKLIFLAKTPEHKRIFELLICLSEATIILNTFIEAFIRESVKKEDGHWYLHGSFNLGGTVSGRLSSSGPNLQNIPSSGTRYAKLIKACFEAPEGWLWVGADFSSLEDKISALTTKDPNKIKVYTDGYDGHSLRAYSYFKDMMLDIVDTVDSINSIADKYPDIRQDSKAPTFLLTYGGTYHGLIANVGMALDQAKLVESKYHILYAVSDQWVADNIARASLDGYVTCAFGLRVRTPVLKQTILNKRSTPYEAQSESRTAGNALGQSYGMLNNRAGIEFQERTLTSKYLYSIKPCAHIHDAQYFLIRDEVEVVEWFNINLVECMQWQKLPAIQHDEVKLGGNVEIFYPTWAVSHKLPNNASRREILNICNGNVI
jgi:DNA polymerase I